MVRLRNFLKFVFAGVVVCLLLTTPACNIIGGESGAETPTPVPTSSVPGMEVVLPQACLLAQQDMIRVEQLQGDLVAWSPVANSVAYVASTQSSSWNVGDLNIISAPDFENPTRLAAQVAGELAWSPAGLNLAYLGLRRSDNLYTIGLVSPEGRTLRDLFPEEDARTDGYSSQKAITEWINEGRLRVQTSCGVDCMQTIDFAILTGLASPVGSPSQSLWGAWTVQTNQPAVIPPAFAELEGQLNWSPDGKLIAYIDENDSAWIIEEESGSLYPLDIGDYGTAFETDWSFDSQYLAVRVDKYLKLFEFDCP